MATNWQHLVVSTVGLALIIWSTRVVTVVAVIVVRVLLQSIMEPVTSTTVASNRKVLKHATNAIYFLAQS